MHLFEKSVRANEQTGTKQFGILPFITCYESSIYYLTWYNHRITARLLFVRIITIRSHFQVTEHLVAASKYTGVRIVPIVGGIAAPKQQRLLSYKPPILVATPGRLWQLIQEHEYLQDLASIKFLVVDEADRFVVKLLIICKHMNKTKLQ